MIHLMVLIGEGIASDDSTTASNATKVSPKAPDIPGIAVRTVYVVSELCG